MIAPAGRYTPNVITINYHIIFDITSAFERCTVALEFFFFQKYFLREMCKRIGMRADRGINCHLCLLAGDTSDVSGVTCISLGYLRGVATKYRCLAILSNKILSYQIKS